MSFASLRSLLFVPGDKPRLLEKARGSGADAVIIDLEDSVAEGSKAPARGMTREFLAETAGRRRHPHLLVRINAVTTAHWTADIEAVMEVRPDGIVLPKPRSGADVVQLSDALDRLEAALGHDAGAPRSWPSSPSGRSRSCPWRATRPLRRGSRP